MLDLNAVLAPATLANPLAALSGITDAIKTAASSAGHALIAPATAVLGAATAVRIVRAWLESALEGDAMSLINEFISSVVLATIIMMALQNYDALCSYAWALGMAAMQLFGEPGQTGADIMDTIWGQTISAMVKLTGIFTHTDSGAGPNCSDPLSWASCQAMGWMTALSTNMVVAVFVGLGLIMLLIFMGMMLYQVMRGIFQVAVALAWMPLTLGFYPLLDSWFKNALGLVASGIANMAMIAFIMSAMGKVIGAIVSDAVNSRVVALPSLPGIPADGVNKITGVLIACLGIMVISFLASAAMSYGTSIFGSVSGWGSFHHRRGGGGGGGNDVASPSKGGDKPGATPAPSKEGGGVETAAKLATDTGAAVASSGATEAATVAKGGSESLAKMGENLSAGQPGGDVATAGKPPSDPSASGGPSPRGGTVHGGATEGGVVQGGPPSRASRAMAAVKTAAKAGGAAVGGYAASRGQALSKAVLPNITGPASKSMPMAALRFYAHNVNHGG